MRAIPSARALAVILLVAVVVSIGHFADNYFNYDAYPKPDSLPVLSATVVLILWLAFTAAAATAYVLFRRAPSNAALLLLAFYSGSGLGGLGHYATIDAFQMPWWRQAAVLADVACGIGVLAFVIRAVRARGRHREQPT